MSTVLIFIFIGTCGWLIALAAWFFLILCLWKRNRLIPQALTLMQLALILLAGFKLFSLYGITADLVGSFSRLTLLVLTPAIIRQMLNIVLLLISFITLIKWKEKLRYAHIINNNRRYLMRLVTLSVIPAVLILIWEFLLFPYMYRNAASLLGLGAGSFLLVEKSIYRCYVTYPLNQPYVFWVYHGLQLLMAGIAFRINRKNEV